jgi:glycosyltransferase involved in cell wall biosynthesis
MKLIEYGAATKCIVATNIPANTQTLSDEKNAIITNPNVQSFAKGLIHAIENFGQCQKYGEELNKDLQAKHTPEAMEKEIKKVVDSIENR